MTFQKAKDQKARENGYATFSRVRFGGTEDQLRILDEAAELYAASQYNQALQDVIEIPFFLEGDKVKVLEKMKRPCPSQTTH